MSLPRESSPVEVEASVAAINPGNNPLDNLRDGWRKLRASHGDILQVTGAICKDDWQTLKMDSQYAWHHNAVVRWQPIKSDYDTLGRGIVAGLSGGALLGTVAIGALRLPMILAPSLAMQLGETQSAATVGTTTAVAMGGWNFVVGQIYDNAIRQHPNTIKALESRLSPSVKFFSKRLPGLKPAAETNSERPGKIRRLGRWGLMNFQRSIAAVGIGMGAYASTASLGGQSRMNTFKLTAKCSLNSGALMGGVTGSLAYGIGKINQEHPQLAETIQDRAESPMTWTAVAIAMVIGQTAWKQRQEKAVQEQSNKKLCYPQTLTCAPNKQS